MSSSAASWDIFLFHLGVQWTNSWMARASIALFVILGLFTLLYAVAETFRMVRWSPDWERRCNELFEAWIVVLQILILLMTTTWMMNQSLRG